MCAFIRVVYTLCTFDFLIFPRLAQFEMDCQTVRARDRLIPGGILLADLRGLGKFLKYGRSAEILDPADHSL